MKVLLRNRLGSAALFTLAASCASPVLFDVAPTDEPESEADMDSAFDVASPRPKSARREGATDGGDAGRVVVDGRHACDAGPDAGHASAVASDAGDEDDAATDASDASDASDADAAVGAEAGPTFPFDTGRLVVSLTESPTANADLYLISTVGTPPVPLTQTPNRHEVAPRWSPDHTKIAFLATPTRPPVSWGPKADLMVMDADGSNPRILASGVDQSLWPPSWSPDGGRIAYMHALPSCAPPYNPNWHSADPCVNDIHAVRLSDGLDEDLGVMPANDKFGVEPEWLHNGQISYFWMCFDEGCNDQGGWYETLLPGASAGSIRNYANMTYAGYATAWCPHVVRTFLTTAAHVEASRLWREANSRDVWLFVTPKEVREAWPQILRHLGRSRAMWAWLLGPFDRRIVVGGRQSPIKSKWNPQPIMRAT